MAYVKITELPQGTPQLTDELAGVDTTGTPTTKKFLFSDQVTFINNYLLAHSTPFTGAQGGTGVANTGKTISLGGNLTTSGAFASTFTMTNTTAVTFPTTGTLSTLADRGYVLISTATASNSATVDFTTLTGYTNYVVYISGLLPATNNTDLYIRVSTDGGSTYAASSGNYWQEIVVGAAGSLISAEFVTNTFIFGGATIQNVSTAPLGGVIEILNPGAGAITTILGKTYFQSATLSQRYSNGGAQFNSTSAVNAIRFLMSSGNIATGSFQLYGVK